MSEIRDIFNRTNENSLVLGDELCKEQNILVLYLL